MTRIAYHAGILFALAVIAAAIGISQRGEHMPRCYEDQVAVRYQVPGPWSCVARDNLENER